MPPRKRPAATDPVEVIARAMCRHADPDEEYRGLPYWKCNERDATRIVEALKRAGMLRSGEGAQ